MSRTEFLYLIRAKLSILLDFLMWEKPQQLSSIHAAARKCSSKELSYRKQMRWVNFQQAHLGQVNSV